MIHAEFIFLLTILVSYWSDWQGSRFLVLPRAIDLVSGSPYYFVLLNRFSLNKAITRLKIKMYPLDT